MSVINTNVKALYTQNALKVSGREQTTAMQQLSTGKRINSARDDAAGLAIANRMSQQIRSLNMAIRNAGDAVSLIQTAEGATASITDMLQRMRELAVQAINDTNAQDQRGYLDLEFQQLKQQIQSISEFTQWNGFPILNGTAGERVGERPVYKVASSGNFVASDTFEAGITTTSEALNKVSVSGPGLFTMAGQLRVVPDVSATFTKPDGTIIDLMDPPDDVDVEDWITVVGNEITIKAASGLVDGNVVLTQTVREDDSDADYAGETIILSTKMPTVEAMQANDIIINGITIGIADGLADTVSAGSSVSASAISRAAAINEKTAQTGVVAVVKTNVMTGAQMVGGEPISGTVTINGYTSARITTTLNNVRESRAAVVDAINAISAQTGVVAINTNSDAEGVRLEALDGRNIELSFNTDSDTEDFSAATGLRQGLQIGSYSLESTVEGPVVVTTTSTTDWSRAGIRPGNYTENTSVYTSGVRDVVADADDIKTLGDGDLSINGIAIRGAMAQDDTRSSVVAATSSRTGSAIAIAAAINASAAQTGVQASVAPASTVATEGPTITQGGTATVYLNGEPVRIDLSEDDDTTTRLNRVITAINLQGGTHGVLAEKTSDGRLMLSTPDGRNLSVWFDSDDWDASELGLEGSAATGISGASKTSDDASTVYGSVLLRSDKAFTLAPGANGFNSDGDFDALKFQQGTYGGEVDESTSKMSPPRTGRLSFHVGASATQTIHIDFADYGSKGPITGGITGDVELSDTAQRVNRIDTVADAQAVLAKLDVALDKVNGNRAVMGAVMNRLDYIMDNLSNVSLNTEASRSQIEDADYAKASTELARTQIMQQAATAVLAQANMDQQTVLKLLQ
jgi:flagellin